MRIPQNLSLHKSIILIIVCLFFIIIHYVNMMCFKVKESLISFLIKILWRKEIKEIGKYDEF